MPDFGMWRELVAAICLMLVIEGIMPFLNPARWRRLVTTMTGIDDGPLRLAGFASMIVGTLMLYLIN